MEINVSGTVFHIEKETIQRIPAFNGLDLEKTIYVPRPPKSFSDVISYVRGNTSFCNAGNLKYYGIQPSNSLRIATITIAKSILVGIVFSILHRLNEHRSNLDGFEFVLHYIQMITLIAALTSLTMDMLRPLDTYTRFKSSYKSPLVKHQTNDSPIST